MTRSFASTLGSVDVPFAVPGQIVTVTREQPVFDQNPTGNAVSLTFDPVGGSQTVVGATALAPLDGSGCPTSRCTAGLCSCLRFEFPDTDDQIASATDDRTLAGRVTIAVATASVATATIGPLTDPTTGSVSTFTPDFVALPPKTTYATLVASPGADVLAAPDAAGNLFIPISYAGLVQPGGTPVQFIEIQVPALAALPTVTVESLTPEGAVLPPFIRRLGATNLFGSTDAPDAVLRVDQGQTLSGSVQQEGRGPIVIPGVTAFADPQKRATNAVATDSRWIVYESHECGPFDPPGCGDLNGDSDTSDYFLRALDLTVPQATPILIDAFDGQDFAGFPATFPPFVYVVDGSDDLVGFRTIETSSFDVDGDLVPGEVIRSGAFDLTRGTRIALADDSPRIAIGGGTLAFTVPDDPVDGPDRLFVYDANETAPGPVGVSDPEQGPPGVVSPILRTPAYTTYLGAFVYAPIPGGEQDLAATSGLVAGVVDESVLGVDTNGDGSVSAALTFFDLDGTGVTDTFRVNTPHVVGRNIQMNDRWIAFEFLDTLLGRQSILVADRNDPLAVPAFICDAPGSANGLVARMSENIIPCRRSEMGLGAPEDLNGDGDTTDFSVMHVYLPNAAGGPVELNLGLASWSLFGITTDRLLIFAVDEVDQNADLDGDGIVGPPPSEATTIWPILHVFNADTRSVRNFRIVTLAAPGTLFEIPRGVSFVGGSITNAADVRLFFLRDLDDDGHFEDPGVDVATGTLALDDNCPSVANPLQQDFDEDGVGDACDAVQGVGVAATKLVVLDKLASSGKAKVAYQSKDKGRIGKGAGADPAAIDASFAVAYDETRGSWEMAGGVFDGTVGWKQNTPVVAKYVDKTGMPGRAKTAILKPNASLKMGASSLGAPALDMVASEVPATSVYTAYAVTNGGSSRVHCTEFPANTCVLTEVAAGTGRKLVCKNGVPDPRCRAQCSHLGLTACAAGDGCCPLGCDADSDADCAP